MFFPWATRRGQQHDAPPSSPAASRDRTDAQRQAFLARSALPRNRTDGNNFVVLWIVGVNRRRIQIERGMQPCEVTVGAQAFVSGPPCATITRMVQRHVDGVGDPQCRPA